MNSEIRIRVKPIVKELLETNKDKYGFTINFQVNFAIFKYLVLDTKVPLWKLDTRPDPHYEVINKLPEDLKFCDGDRCELPFGEKIEESSVRLKGIPQQRLEAEDHETISRPRGDKC